MSLISGQSEIISVIIQTKQSGNTQHFLAGQWYLFLPGKLFGQLITSAQIYKPAKWQNILRFIQ